MSDTNYQPMSAETAAQWVQMDITSLMERALQALWWDEHTSCQQAEAIWQGLEHVALELARHGYHDHADRWLQAALRFLKASKKHAAP